jgi:histidinol-phosphatase (PHP family)
MHDYHVHTHYCRHATGTLEQYARAAVRLGLTEICFTPHIPLPVYRPGSYGGRLRMDPHEFPRFMEEIERIRPRVPGLTILAGVEADYVEGAEEYLARFLASWPLDLVLMSIHFVRTWPEPRWVFDFSGDSRPLVRIYDDYFEAVRSGIRSGLFDCVAHLDLIKQPGSPPADTHAEQIDEIIHLCREAGMSAEINMSGARKAIGEPYPSWSVVRRMESLGLPLVPGSDAHAPDLVGSGLDQLRGLPLVRYRGRRIMDARLDALPAGGA